MKKKNKDPQPTKEQIKKFKSLPPRVQQMIVDGIFSIDDDLSEAIARARDFDED